MCVNTQILILILILILIFAASTLIVEVTINLLTLYVNLATVIYKHVMDTFQVHVILIKFSATLVMDLILSILVLHYYIVTQSTVLQIYFVGIRALMMIN